MTFTEENLQATSGHLEATLNGSDNVDNHEAEAGKLAGLKDLVRGSRGTLLGLVFLAGLLLGWVVIGWWLWPVKWTNSEPWLLRPEHQRTFVGLVADDYWHTRDVSRARQALAGWDDEALTNLMATMQSQASSPEECQHLAALADALALPNPEESLLTSLLNHKILILSAVLSAAPLVAAIALAVSPLMRRGVKKHKRLLGQGVEDLEEELEQLLAQEKEQQAQEEEQEAGEEEEEKEWEEGEEEEEGNEWLDEEIGEEDQTIQGILSGIFEEEDETLGYYASICKNLEDIDIDDLVQKSQEVMGQIVRSNTLRQA